MLGPLILAGGAVLCFWLGLLYGGALGSRGAQDANQTKGTGNLTSGGIAPGTPPPSWADNILQELNKQAKRLGQLEQLVSKLQTTATQINEFKSLATDIQRVQRTASDIQTIIGELKLKIDEIDKDLSQFKPKVSTQQEGAAPGQGGGPSEGGSQAGEARGEGAQTRLPVFVWFVHTSESPCIRYKPVWEDLRSLIKEHAGERTVGDTDECGREVCKEPARERMVVKVFAQENENVTPVWDSENDSEPQPPQTPATEASKEVKLQLFSKTLDETMEKSQQLGDARWSVVIVAPPQGFTTRGAELTQFQHKFRNLEEVWLVPLSARPDEKVEVGFANIFCGGGPPKGSQPFSDRPTVRLHPVFRPSDAAQEGASLAGNVPSPQDSANTWDVDFLRELLRRVVSRN
ncbi:MAG: hypothetical protein RMJ16_10025 [Thermoguttaceae bacterium]|nr:hypothetical protein [Thermoguttaceae bacterium]